MRNPIASFTPLLALVTVLQCGPTRAATVTSTADSGPGSLRAAIASAADGETIDFSIGGTITLSSGELLIDKDLTISGPGAGNLIIQRSAATGTSDFRIFEVVLKDVVISGLTVKNGRDDVGGGIYTDGDLTLKDCVITGNVATESGGGIANASSLTMSNCVISGNSAIGETEDGFGGGFYNMGTAEAINCVFSTNSVTSATGSGFGGGVCNDATLTLTGSVVKDNSANGGPNNGGGIGGGINNGLGTLEMNTSTLTGNVARGGSGGAGGPGEGGGVANDIGSVTLDRCTVSGNSALGGNGTTGGSGQGGGMANGEGSTYVYSSTVSGNSSSGGSGTTGTAAPHGSGIFNFGSLVVTHSTITANVVPAGFPNDGAGIFNLGATVKLKNTILAANTGTVELANDEHIDIWGFPSEGVTFSDGYNLVGSTSGLVFPGAGDQFNVTAAALKLGPLQNNGGPTFTHALLCGSAAINAGDNADAPPTDQRGFARIVGGAIDIGAYEANHTAPTISCPAPAALNYVPPTGPVATVSVNVGDADGDPLVVVWTVDGTAYQTNLVAAGGPPTAASVTFTASFGIGSHSVQVRVTDSAQCEAACATTVFVAQVEEPPLPPAPGGELYPIALNEKSLAGVPVGGVINDIYNGIQPGNFGWLTWAGSPSETTLVKSLRAPGNSGTYINPLAPTDHTVSVGDWVQGKPGVTNSKQVRDALDALKQIDITVPVWDQARGTGNNGLYRVVAFARVRLVGYQLPRKNRISAQFLGLVSYE